MKNHINNHVHALLILLKNMESDYCRLHIELGEFGYVSVKAVEFAANNDSLYFTDYLGEIALSIQLDEITKIHVVGSHIYVTLLDGEVVEIIPRIN